MCTPNILPNYVLGFEWKLFSIPLTLPLDDELLENKASDLLSTSAALFTMFSKEWSFVECGGLEWNWVEWHGEQISAGRKGYQDSNADPVLISLCRRRRQDPKQERLHNMTAVDAFVASS